MAFSIYWHTLNTVADIVINNAGILRDKSFARISDMDWGESVIHQTQSKLASYKPSVGLLMVKFSKGWHTWYALAYVLWLASDNAFTSLGAHTLCFSTYALNGR